MILYMKVYGVRAKYSRQMRYRFQLVVDDQLGYELSESEPISSRTSFRSSGPVTSGVLEIGGGDLHVDGLGQGGDDERIPPLVFTAAQKQKEYVSASIV
jgi:hypothetical protein